MVRRRQSRRAPRAISGSNNVVRRQRILVHVNHDLKTLAAVAGRKVASEEILRQGHHTVRARGPV
jgi:hypothetical protein